MHTTKTIPEVLGDIYNEKVIEPGDKLQFRETFSEGIAEILELCFSQVRSPLSVSTPFQDELLRVDTIFREFQAKYDIAHALYPDFFKVAVYDRLMEQGFPPHWVNTLYIKINWPKKHRGLGIGFINELYYGDEEGRPE